MNGESDTPSVRSLDQRAEAIAIFFPVPFRTRTDPVEQGLDAGNEFRLPEDVVFPRRTNKVKISQAHASAVLLQRLAIEMH